MAEDLIIYTPMYIAFFWVVMLFISKHERRPNRVLLGVFMMVIFLHYTTNVLFYNNFSHVLHIFDPIFVFTSLSIYPLLFWYIKLLTQETDFRWENLIYFIPAVTLAVASFTVYKFMDAGGRQAYFNEFILKKDGEIPFSAAMKAQKFIFIASRLIFFIQVIYIVIKGLKLVKQFNRQVEEFYSNTESRSINWANFILYALVVSMIISVPVNILGRGFFANNLILLLIPNLGLGAIVFLFGIHGYHQIYTIRDLEMDINQNNDDLLPKNVNKQKLNDKLLDLFINEEIYKNPDLKITHLSEKLHTNRTYISKHINTEYSCTFSDFVNRYRIEEAKRLLTEDSTKTYSLNYISEKSGFGSMVNFMRVFREIEGITPGRYRENNA
jgi:AraC-like DNA-binding protein